MKKCIVLIMLLLLTIGVCLVVDGKLKNGNYGKGDKDEGALVKNVYVLYADESQMYVYTDGKYKEYDCDFLEASYENVIADIVVSKNKVEKVYIKSEIVTGKLVEIGEDTIFIDKYGKVPLEKQFKIYNTFSEIEEKSAKELYLGYDKYDYIVADGKVAAIIIKDEITVENIRVLLKNSDYTQSAHGKVTMSGTGEVLVERENGTVSYKSGEEISVVAEDLKEGERIKVLTAEGEKIKISTITRVYGTPEYSGSIEVMKKDGLLYVINEVSLEEYLRSVVPSEMPYTYELEALKAQAVCARTYAYSHMLNAGLKEYGAHVDDSVTYQVYNNGKTNENTDRAVRETLGQVLKCGEELAGTNYYSTSCGYGGDESVWGNESVNTNSLINHSINEENTVLQLSDNTTFSKYIKSENPADYDYSYPYYRWRGKLDLENLEGKLNIGTLENIQVTNRLENGNAYEIIFTGTDGEKKVNTQYAIRELLGGAVSNIYNKSDDKVNMSLLPSAYFVLEPTISDGMVTECSIYGGGLGHGVGMSQNAANEMASQGKKHNEILTFFFANSYVENVY